jgi:hypothetical protein
MTIKQFEVYVQNKPGDLARVAEVLSKNAVNIRGITTDMGGGKPMVRIITDDENSARSAFKNSGIKFTERDVIIISMPDRPGELAKVTQKVARAGINIESIFMLGNSGDQVQIAIGVDQREKAQKLLHDQA